MAAAQLDILIEQGSTFFYELTFKDDTNALIDLTGYTFAAELRATISSPTVIDNFTCVVRNQTTNKGQMYFTLTATQTKAIVLKQQTTATRITQAFCYDLNMTLADAVTVDRVLQGVANVSPEVTT